jgi:hypothetical protein
VSTDAKPYLQPPDHELDRLMNLERDIKAANDEIEQLKSPLKFGCERFAGDDETIKFYTGFPSYQHFITFFEFVKPSAQTMTYCYASNMSVSRPGSKKMVLVDELFMFLVRIRLGLLQQDCCYRFNVNVSTISRKIVSWANYIFFSWNSTYLALT